MFGRRQRKVASQQSAQPQRHMHHQQHDYRQYEQYQPANSPMKYPYDHIQQHGNGAMYQQQKMPVGFANSTGTQGRRRSSQHHTGIPSGHNDVAGFREAQNGGHRNTSSGRPGERIGVVGSRLASGVKERSSTNSKAAIGVSCFTIVLGLLFVHFVVFSAETQRVLKDFERETNNTSSLEKFTKQEVVLSHSDLKKSLEVLSAGEADLDVLEPQIVEYIDGSGKSYFGPHSSSNDSFSNQIPVGDRPLELLSPSHLKLRLSRLAEESEGTTVHCAKGSALKNKDFNVTVVTAVSSKDYGYFAGLTKHLEQDMNMTRLVVFDFGLTNMQRHMLMRVISYIKDFSAQLISFNGSNYGLHLSNTGKASFKAFKSIIIAQVAISYPGVVLWIDPRTQIHKRIDDAIAGIPCHGFISVSNSHGSHIRDMVSQTVLDDLNIEPALRKMVAHDEDFFGFDTRIGSVLKSIISPWLWCTTKSSCYGKQIDYIQKSQLRSSESLLTLFSMQHLQSRQGIADEKSLGISFASNLAKKEIEKDERRLLHSKIALTIVSGANSDPDFFSMLLALVNSIGSQEKSGSQSEISALGSTDRAVRLVIYDLGMTEPQHMALEKGFQIMGSAVHFRSLDFEKYPSHISVDRENGAWKAVVCAEVMEEFGGIIMFLDAKPGLLLKKPLDRIRDFLLNQGFVTTKHPVDTVGEFSHESTIRYFEGLAVPQPALYPAYAGASAKHISSKEKANFVADPEYPILSASIMGWDASNVSVIENIFKPFLECCLDENCIAPAYAMQQSHRFADTALSLAVNRVGVSSIPKRNDLSITDHSDVKGVSEFDIKGVEVEKKSCEGDGERITVITAVPRIFSQAPPDYTVSSIDVSNELTVLGKFLHSLQDMLVENIIIYDMGFPETESQALSELIAEVKGAYGGETETEKSKPSRRWKVVPQLRVIDLSKYPSHFLSTGAYKAVLLSSAVEEFGGLILYLDSNIQPLAKLSSGGKNDMVAIRDTLACEGFLSSHFGGTLHERVSADMLARYDVDSTMQASQPLHSAIIGFNAYSDETIDGVLRPWTECCLDIDCIGKPGTSRKFHQYEQSALSIIAMQYGIKIPQPSKAELSLETMRYDCYNESDPLTFVTAIPTSSEAEEVELKELELWVDQAQALSNDIILIIYDIGLSEEGRKQLENMAMKKKATVRQFDKDSYVNRSTNTAYLVPDLVETSCYKAVILSELEQELEGVILWLDPDWTPLTKDAKQKASRLEALRIAASCDGFVSTHVGGSVLERTHLAMISFLKVEKDIRDLHPLNSGVIGIHARNANLKSGLLDPWTDCCFNARCIQELGLSRKNHQYEQAALTVLAYQWGIPYPQPSKKKLLIENGLYKANEGESR